METVRKSANEIYYYFLENDLDHWFVYEPNPVGLSRYPDLHELLALKYGDCVGGSYLEVMVLRSLGIPSTIDYVPLWGRKNGTHCSDVFWDNELQRFRIASGRAFEFPTKVFRYTFKRQGIWTDSILPVIQKTNIFLLDFLKHDHWLDVTHEHTSTATIDYEYDFSSDYAYICVFNYGQWIPIYWSKVMNERVRFENMGTEMLYRTAVPQKNSYEIISPVFHVDKKGNKTFFKPDYDKKINLNLSKLNTGSKSWVEKEKEYCLYYFDEKSDCIVFETQKCERDSLIIFEGVPSNTLYRLRDVEQNRRLERIFTYENEEQIF